MNILNENEAIVINSLENWGKVAETLVKDGWNWANGQKINDITFEKSLFPLWVGITKGELYYSAGINGFSIQRKIIQDTEFITKHLKNTDMFNDVHPPKPNKDIKIRVLKENGLLEVGKEYLFTKNDNIVVYWQEDGMPFNFYKWQHGVWLKNGYIEEAKEVSYRFEDIKETIISSPFLELEAEGTFATEKQAKQANAFRKLTHVRAKILKDAGFSEDWKPKSREHYFVPVIDIYDNSIIAERWVFLSYIGLEIGFPTKELAELALQHNQELFKMYLGV